jgi:hypothetical protein
MVRMLKMGELRGKNGMERCKDSLIPSNSKISVMKGFRKDHKKAENEVKGPPMRPVVGASQAMNAGLSVIIGDVIDKYAEERDKKREFISDSTEDMIANLEGAKEDEARGKQRQRICCRIIRCRSTVPFTEK